MRRAPRPWSWVGAGALALLWAGSLAVVGYAATAHPHGNDLHVSGYLDCGSSPSPTRITAAPTVRIGLDGDTATVDLTLSLQSPASQCQLNYTPIGPAQSASVDGRPVAVPDRGPWAVVVPTDGRVHDVRLRWSGRRSAAGEAVGRSAFTVSTYLSFPLGRGQVLGTGRLDDSDGPVLQLRVPPGHRPGTIDGGVRRGRDVAVPVGVGGLTSGVYRFEFDRTATRWIGASAPYVFTATSTLLVVLGLMTLGRRRRSTSG